MRFDVERYTRRIAAGKISIAAALLLCLCLSHRALGQASNDSSSKACNPLLTAGPAGKDPCGEATQDSSQTEISEAVTPPLLTDDAQSKPVYFHYVPALNGGDPIIVPQPFHVRYLYGAATSQGFDSAAAGPFRNLPTFESVYDGYLATSMQWTKTYLLLQHDSTFTHYTSPEIQGNLFHRTALLATGDFNRFLSWDFEARNTYGNDSLQLINPLPSTMVGQFATAEPVSADFGINHGTVWGTDLVGALTWRPDVEHTFKFFARDAYHRLFADNSHDDIGTVKLEYQKSISERSTYGFYGQVIRQTGQIRCASEGAGVEFTTKPSPTAILEFAVGPEFGSSGCGRQQAFNLHFAGAKTLSATLRAYLTANREYSSGYVSQGTWEDNVVAGVGKELSRQVELGFDAGYVKGRVLGRLTAYSGFFASCELRKRLSNSFTLVAAYRRFDHTVSQEAVRRNIVMVSLLWTPWGHDARRGNQYGAASEAIVDARGKHEE